jgi:hypothetical protein
MDRQQKIKILTELKAGNKSFKELMQNYELPDIIIFFNGMTEIKGEKITYDEYKKRFPDNTRDIIIFSPALKSDKLIDEKKVS